MDRDIREMRELRGNNLRTKIYRKRINPLESLSEIDFKKIYRFSKNTVRKIIDLIRNDIKPISGNGGSISAELQVCITLRYFSKGSYQQEIADLHGVSRQTISRIIKKVSFALARKRAQFISFPIDTEDMKNQFYKIANMPNIVGAIDGTHIKIKNPGGEFRDTYICRKGYHSLNVQMICDANCKITDIVARWRGSAHDSRIWNESNIKTKFENGEIDGILLGDNGYACTSYLLTPLLNPQPGAETRFNRAHIKTRGIIEKLFGRLKMKFRAAYNTFQINISTVKACIIAIAVLHNIAVDDYLDEHLDEEDDINVEYEDDLRNNEVNAPGHLFRQNYIRRYF